MRLRENEISFAYLKNNRRRFKNAIAGFASFFIFHRRRLKPQSVLVYYFFQTKKIGRFEKSGLVSDSERKKP
jgi:hypothetical protein